MRYLSSCTTTRYPTGAGRSQAGCVAGALAASRRDDPQLISCAWHDFSSNMRDGLRSALVLTWCAGQKRRSGRRVRRLAAAVYVADIVDSTRSSCALVM